MNQTPKKGVILIPDDRYWFCVRIDQISKAEDQDTRNFWTPDPPGTFRLTCTRFDLSDSREPVMAGRGDPYSIFVVKPDGPGRWLQTESAWDDEAPITFTEFGQLSLF